MVGLIQNVGESLGFGFAQCYGDGFKGFLRMVTLLILMCIPIANFIPMGIFLKIFKGENPDFNDADEGLIRGFLLFVISLIYMLIPIILLAIGVALSGAAINIFEITSIESALGVAGAVAGGAGLIFAIISIIAAVILGVFWVPAEINYARNGFAGAFKFSEIFGMISKVGVAKYILSFIIYIIFYIIVTAIIAVILILPTMISSLVGVLIPSVESLMLGVGTTVTIIITILITILVTVPLTLFEYRYWANLFKE